MTHIFISYLKVFKKLAEVTTFSWCFPSKLTMSHSMKSLWCVHAPWRGYDTFWDDFVCEKMQTRSRSPAGCSPVSPGLSAGLKLLHWFSNCENYAADFRILHCFPWCTQHLRAVQCTALTAVTFQWALKSRVWTRHLVFFTIALGALAFDFSTCQLLQVSDQIILFFIKSKI